MVVSIIALKLGSTTAMNSCVDFIPIPAIDYCILKARLARYSAGVYCKGYKFQIIIMLNIEKQAKFVFKFIKS